MNLDKLVTALSRVPGVSAIALGGSHSRNEADEKSDYDIGVYYNQDIDLIVLENSLKALDDQHRDNILNPPGEWGPWINGGSWLTVDGIPVDILLRDVKHVESVLNDCVLGKITVDYQCGHPFGFTNTIYAAETHYCKTLWQNKAMSLDQLKALLHSKGEYSPLMREAVIKKFLWEAGFSIACSRKAAFRGDINYTMGSVFRAVGSWVEVLYALNNVYLMNEKGSLPKIHALNRKPKNLEAAVRNIYQQISEGDLEEAYKNLDDLHREIEELSSELELK